MAQGYRRKKFFFRDSFQGKYILSYFIIAGLVTLLFTFLFIYFSSNTLSITYSNHDLKLGQTPEVLMDMILSIHGILIFICGLAIVYFTTRFTHRIVGPIYKISRTIDTMAAGDLNIEIYLRKNDEYKDIAEKINYFNATMYRKLKELETISKELDVHVSRTLDNASPDNPERQYGEDLDPLTVINDKLKYSLSFFDLSGEIPPD